MKTYVTMKVARETAQSLDRGEKPSIPPSIVIWGLIHMLQDISSEIKNISTRMMWVYEDIGSIHRVSNLDMEGSIDREALEE